MSVDTMIESLIAALDRNTAALEKAGAAPATTATQVTEKPATRAKADKPAKEEAPKVTQEQMNAALIKLKDSFGMPEAKGIISEFGGCEKMAEIKPAKYQAVYDAAVKKFDELTAAASGPADEEM